MKPDRSQILAIAGFTILFFVIYLGFDTKSKEQEALVKTRAQNLELINIDKRIEDRSKALDGQAQAYLQELQHGLEGAEDSIRIDVLKALASFWYSNNAPLISGHYASRIAEEYEDNAEAWGIAGTTFSLAARKLADDNDIQYAVDKSRQAFENAISIDPDQFDYQINLALSYVDNPDQANPMKGILMLLDLNKKEPDNTAVLMQLGRLALGTNQLEKAVERLSRVIELEPDNKKAHCYLAEAYEKLGQTDKAQMEIDICNS